MFPSRRPVTAVAVLLALALAASACTTEADRGLGDPSGRVQSGAAWNPETLAPLPVVDAVGPSAVDVDGVVLDGTTGSSTSTTPTLRWARPPAGGPWRFAVTDLGPDGGRELWSSGDVPVAEARVPAGVLANGRAYRWRVVDTGTGAALGPFVMRIDVQRDGLQPVDGLGGVGVARYTGEPVIGWDAPTLATSGGDVGLSLVYRPSNGAATTGLPDGWRLTAGATGSWRRLLDNGDGTLTLENEAGVPVVFEPNPGADGGYRAVWGDRQTWPSGSFSTLVRDDDGITVQDTDGTVTTFDEPGADGVGHVRAVRQAGRATVRQSFRDGRLVAVTDPVSERSIRLDHGGDEDCPATMAGFDPTPTGLLCGARLWDGTRLRLGYRTVTDEDRTQRTVLARLVAFSGSGATAAVTDLAVDRSGRPVAVRSPAAAAAVAAGVRDADASVTTEVAYDDRGRVDTVTLPAPTAGAPRAVRAFSREVREGRVVGTITAPAAPGGPLVSTATADATTFQLAETAGPDGLVATATWDPATGALLSTTTGQGLLTRYERDGLGALTRRVGPAAPDAVASGAAPATEVGTDLGFRDGRDLDGRPLEGLAVTYWTNATRSGEPERSEVGPRPGGDVPDEYRFSWDRSPVGADTWSARLLGAVVLPADGEWTFTTGGAPLWIDERPCRPSCTVTAAAGRALRVRLDVAGPAGDVDLSWSGPERSGPVPTSALVPALGRQSRVATRDALTAGVAVDMVGRTTYSDPVTATVDGSWTGGGQRREVETEPFRPAQGRYGRVTAQKPAVGAARQIDYHPATTGVADPCGSGTFVQGGLVRTNADPTADPDRPVRTFTVYDAAGRTVASVSDDSGRSFDAVVADRSTPWTCTRHDAAGRPVRTEQRGAEGTEERLLEVSWTGPSGDPTTAVSRSTAADGSVATETVQRDLLGRAVRSVDLWGTVTERTYDTQFPERLLTEVVRPVGAPAQTLASTYDGAGNRVAVSLDGVPLSSTTWANGRLDRVRSGTETVAFDYDANGRPVERTITGPSGRWVELQSVSPAGRTLAAALEGPGANRATWTYAYDVDARLVSAAVDTPLPVTERAWTYTFDGDSNLVSRTITGGDSTVRTVTSTFDRGDQLTGTDDPLLAGPVRSDLGRLTRVGPLEVDYLRTGPTRLVRHTDGSSVSYRYRFGRLVQRTVGGAGGAGSEVRLGDAGVVYDAAGAYQGRLLSGGGGATLWLGADGTVRRTYETIGGNRWFAVDGTGALVGTMAVYEPFGREVTVRSDEPTPGATAPGAAASGGIASGAPTPTAPTTTAPTTTAPITTAPTTTARPTTAPASTTPTTAPTTAAPPTTAPTTTAPTTAPTPTTVPPAAPGPPIRPGYQGGDGVRLGALDVIGFGSRTYLPALGRFLQRDPVVGGSGNPYAYTDGDPVNGHDTSGNFTEWFESLDWDLIGTWTAAVAVAAASVALANAAGPAAGLFVANRIPGSATLLTRTIARTATSALVGGGVGVGGAAGSLAILGGDLSTTNLAYGAAAGAAVGLIRPALFLRQARTSGVDFGTKVGGRNTTASLRLAWVEFKRGFGSRATYTDALDGPTIFNQAPTKTLTQSKVSSVVDELDIQTQEFDGSLSQLDERPQF